MKHRMKHRWLYWCGLLLMLGACLLTQQHLAVAKGYDTGYDDGGMAPPLGGEGVPR
jgi:hypothetical protein